MEWNTLQTTNIYVGQKLKLIGVKTVVNKTPKTPEKPVKTPEKSTKKYYEVKSGDSATRIAKKYHLTLDQLEKLNKGVSLKRLKTGQKLRIK
jgi:LysM repeat protein